MSEKTKSSEKVGSATKTRNWETFTGGRGKLGSTSPRITLNKRGFLVLNELAVIELRKDDPNSKGVALLFDRGTNSIGLRPSNDALTLYKLRKNSKAKSYSIWAQSFCNHYGIPTNETIVFDEIGKEKNILILDLGKAHPLNTPKSVKKKK